VHWQAEIVKFLVEFFFEWPEVFILFEGYTTNYIRVAVATNENIAGEIRPVRIESIMEDLALGFLI